MLPADPFGRIQRLPGDFSLDGRVKLLGEAAEALLRGEMPSDEARLFMAGGVAAWLNEGGDLVGDFWRVRGPQGSTRTAAVVWNALREERQDDDEPSE